MLHYTELYKSAKNSEISKWSIWSQNDKIIIESQAGLHHQPTRFEEEVPEGKAGRTRAQQIESRINSRIKVKLDHGYVTSIDQAKNSVLTNQLNLPMPMLAERFDKQKSVNLESCYVQRKYDGHRCLIARIGHEYVAYSRRGIQIDTIQHILNSLHFPDGYVLDGELYCHSVPLQTIASWAKRLQPDTLKLKFHCYDVITPDDDDYVERMHFLNTEVKFNDQSEFVQTIKYTDIIHAGSTLSNSLKLVRNDGYEGLILRPKDCLYTIGRRSKSLLKVKHYEDAEFKVVDVEISRLGWGILHLLAYNGLTFKATAPGNDMQRKHVAKNPKEYIGKIVTVEYANLTNKGVPFQPVATRWHTEL